MVWEWILGVRPELEGLRIDPCLPSHWTRARMVRDYRGSTYDIAIEKKVGIQKGQTTVFLDGKQQPQNLIRPQGDGKTHKVKVVVS